MVGKTDGMLSKKKIRAIIGILLLLVMTIGVWWYMPRKLVTYVKRADHLYIVRREFIDFPIMKYQVEEYELFPDDEAYIKIMELLSCSYAEKTLKSLKAGNGGEIKGNISIDLYFLNNDGERDICTLVVDEMGTLYVSNDEREGKMRQLQLKDNEYFQKLDVLLSMIEE